MKVIIAGGNLEIDFLIKMFNKKEYKLIIINNDKEFCENISVKNNIPVFYGDMTKKYVLEEAGVENAEVLIALSNKDAENLIVCQMAKMDFNVQKTVCITSNPKNVEIFKRLGVNSVVSATYLLAKTIKREATIEDLINVLSIEDDKIVITEIEIKESYKIVNCSIKDIKLPASVNISCIIRGGQAIIPNGFTTILPEDRLIIISVEKNQELLLKIIQEQSKNEKKQ